MYYDNGQPVPLAPCHVLRKTLDELNERGLSSAVNAGYSITRFGLHTGA